MARQHLTAVVSPFLAALLLASCSSSSTTSVVAPSTDKCAVAVSASPSSFPASGGNGSVAVSTTRDCTWSLASDSAWVSFAGVRDGQGEATVAFSIAPNPTASPRNASIVVGSDRQTLSQAGAPCRFELSRTSEAIGPDAATLSLSVTTLSGCAWSATSNASWIAITGGRSANASGTVTIAVAANPGAARVGEANIAGQTYTVSQAAAAVPPAQPGPSPSPVPPPSGGGGTTTTPVVVTGPVSNLSGHCPALTFQVGDTTVTTSAATTFAGGACTDIKKKTNVTVTGTPSGASAIDAQSVVILRGTS